MSQQWATFVKQKGLSVGHGQSGSIPASGLWLRTSLWQGRGERNCKKNGQTKRSNLLISNFLYATKTVNARVTHCKTSALKYTEGTLKYLH